MSIREEIVKHQKVTATIAIIVCAAAIIYTLHTATAPSAASHLANTYFSNNDGSSYFADEATNAFALERQSSPAYVAAVYSCDGERGHQFVAYLTRQQSADLEAIDKAKADEAAAHAKYAFNDVHVANAQDAVSAKTSFAMSHSEVKRPGSANHWVLMSSPEGQDIINNIKCPGGSGTPQKIVP